LSPAAYRLAASEGRSVLPRAVSAPGLPAVGRPLPSLELRPCSVAGGSSEAQAEKSWASAHRQFDRKLSCEFHSKNLAKLHDEEAAESDGCLSPAIDQGLSFSATFQNFKKEQYSLQFDRAQSSPSSSGPAAARLEAMVAATAEAEALGLVNREGFIEDVLALNTQIEDLSKSLSFSHLSANGADARKNAAKEEERRRKEAELRRARKKEQMARDPKRKVALRLENKRRFNDLEEEKGNEKQIPMQKIGVQGAKGPERVEIVDILKIKNQCEFLDQGASVKHMLETRYQKERIARAISSHGHQNSAVLSSPMGSLGSLGSTAKSLQERLDRAATMAEEQYVGTILSKMSTMRMEWSTKLPFNLESKMQAGQRRILIGSPYHSSLQGTDLAQQLSRRLKGQGFHPGKGCAVSSLKSLSSIAGPECEELPSLEEVAALKKQEAARERQRDQAQMQISEASRARVRKHWAAARAFVKWTMILFRQRKVEKATRVVQAVLIQLGEWARMKKAVKQMARSVQMLQKASRSFLVLKRKRCNQMEKDWNKIEDQHLSDYFRMCAKKLIQEHKELTEGISMTKEIKRSKAKSEAYKLKQEMKQEMISMMEASLAGGDIEIDWRSYRLPPTLKQAIIKRYYMVQLAKHVRCRSDFIDVVKSSILAEKEIIQFLKSLGAETLDSKDFYKNALQNLEDAALKVEKPSFKIISEDTVMMLLALAVQTLADARIEPFQDHPANLDLPSNHPRNSENGSGQCDVGDPVVFANAVLKLSEKPCSTGRLGRTDWHELRPSAEAAAVTAPSPTAPTPDGGPAAQKTGEDLGDAGALLRQHADIEEVLMRLTPRLRLISEEQSRQQRQNKLREAEGP